MKKRLLTIDDLVQFCKQQKMYSFNSQTSGYSLYAQVPSTFEVQNENAQQGLLPLKIKVFHTGLNRNGSYVSEENAKKAMATIKNRPVLANIHQLDNGEWDFQAHDVEIIENENGEMEYRYIESQIGSFTEEQPFLEYDETTDKTYVVAYAVIPEEYSRAAEILREKNGSKNSCELCINSFSYNAKENYLELEDFYVSASTLLGRTDDGTEIQEGMLGSRADLRDFSMDINTFSMDKETCQKMIQSIDKLTATLSTFDIDTVKKGGSKLNKLEELLSKYNKTVEDLSFDYSSMNDEELETAFVEAFEDVEIEIEDVDETEVEEIQIEETEVEEFSITCSECGASVDDGSTTCPECGANLINEENDDEDNFTLNTGKRFTINEDGTMEITFSLSHNEIRNALYNLIYMYDELDNDYYYIRDVYDDYVVMQGWCNNFIYRQNYVIEEDNVSLTGERVRLYEMLLTESEKLAIENMKADYQRLVDFEKSVHTKEENEKKTNLLNSADYASIAETEEFKALKDNMETYSYEELEMKADLLIAKFVKSQKFAIQTETKPHKLGISFQDESPEHPYGHLFDNIKKK